jgi:effector-binding domain-containing protein
VITEGVLPVSGEVKLTTVDPMPTAVVAATTTWTEFPTLWGPMLDKVWSFLRAAPQGVRKDGHNVMLYKDDTPNVEVGVQVSGPFSHAGDVLPSQLPGGVVATATHLGPIGKIGETHDAVVAWCASNGHPLSRVRWEVYGDPDASGHFTVDIYWSVRASG